MHPAGYMILETKFALVSTCGGGGPLGTLGLNWTVKEHFGRRQTKFMFVKKMS